MVNSKEHILSTSLFLFLQKGFKEVTMRDIVEKTGMSKGAFYHYFSSKERLFEEVIHFFFSSAVEDDFKIYPQLSLFDFYNHILKQNEDFRLKLETLVKDYNVENSNYYYLLFDAMRILPGFKEQHAQQQKEELSTWKKVISYAKKNNEIKTEIKDDVLARLFINLGDGTNINLILNDDIEKKPDELKKLWDSLYSSIKI